VNSPDVEDPARGHVGHRGVEQDFAREARDADDERRELRDGAVLARPDVDVAGPLVVLEQEDQRLGEVVGVEDLATGRAAAPDCDARIPSDSGLVEAASRLLSGYDTTELGNAYMALILGTPIPSATFIDPRTGTIIEVKK
jgi:hypothetical protein